MPSPARGSGDEPPKSSPAASPAVAILASWIGVAVGLLAMLALGSVLGPVVARLWQLLFGTGPHGLLFESDAGWGFVGGWLLAALVGYYVGVATQRGLSWAICRVVRRPPRDRP